MVDTVDTVLPATFRGADLVSKMIKVSILTISNTRTDSDDTSGKTIKEVLLNNGGFEILKTGIVPDKEAQIKESLVYFSDNLKTDIIFTTGGTGFGPYDITPEATKEVIQKKAPGLAELIRFEGLKKTRRAALSRGIAGIRGRTLIINLPGSPKGARESLESVIELLPHAVDIIKGEGH